MSRSVCSTGSRVSGGGRWMGHGMLRTEGKAYGLFGGCCEGNMGRRDRACRLELIHTYSGELRGVGAPTTGGSRQVLADTAG